MEKYNIEIKLNIAKIKKQIKLNGELEVYKYINEFIYDILLAVEVGKFKKKILIVNDKDRF